MRRGEDARTAIERRAEVVPLAHVDIADVDCHTHRELANDTPVLALEAALRPLRRRRRSSGVAEHAHGAVTRVFEDGPARLLDGCVEDVIVGGEHRGHLALVEVPQADRRLDVGEEEHEALRGDLTASRQQSLIVLEDLQLQVAEFRRRIDAELIEEQLPALVERSQRFGLTPGPVQRHHKLASEVLPEGVLHYERSELRNEFAAAPGGELGVHEHLDRPHPQFFESSRLLPQAGHIEEVGVGETPPEIECVPEGACGGRWLNCHRRFGCVEEPLELIDVGGRSYEHVGASAALDRRFAEHGPQVGDVGVHRGAGGLWRDLAPQAVDHSVDSEPPRPVESKKGEDGSLLRATQIEEFVPASGLEASEHPDLDRRGGSPVQHLRALPFHMQNLRAPTLE